MMKFRVTYSRTYEWDLEAESILWAEVRANDVAKLWPAGVFKLLSIVQTDPPPPVVEPPKPFVPKPKKEPKRKSFWNTPVIWPGGWEPPK